MASSRLNWTPAEIEQICTRYDAGQSVRDLSKSYDCPRESIRFVLFAGHQRRLRKESPAPCVELETREVMFRQVPIRSRFIFRGIKYTKEAMSMAADDERNWGHHFLGETLVTMLEQAVPDQSSKPS